MNIRLKARHTLRQLVDTVTRTAADAEEHEGTCLGPREFGILVVVAACMLFMAAGARAALNEPMPVPTGPAFTLEAQRLIQRAHSEWKAGDHAAVVDTLSEVAEAPGLPRGVRATVLFDRGNAYLQLGDALSALADFETSLRFAHPEPERVYLLSGIVYEILGDLGQAARSYVKALTAAPGNEAINLHVMRFFDRQ